jgi:hypothetical protein
MAAYAVELIRSNLKGTGGFVSIFIRELRPVDYPAMASQIISISGTAAPTAGLLSRSPHRLSQDQAIRGMLGFSIAALKRFKQAVNA